MVSLDNVIEETLCKDVKIYIDSAEFYARICDGVMKIYGIRYLERSMIQYIFSKLLDYAKSRGLNIIEVNFNDYHEFEGILNRLGFKTVVYDDYDIRYLKNL